MTYKFTAGDCSAHDNKFTRHQFRRLRKTNLPHLGDCHLQVLQTENVIMRMSKFGNFNVDAFRLKKILRHDGSFMQQLKRNQFILANRETVTCR